MTTSRWPPEPWWRHAVVYQIYPRSFCDTNGDGIGDLRGITEKLDYLEWLGVDALWLSPVFTSPMADNGYDVADYTDIDPMFGTIGDMDDLVAESHRRGMRILLDFVPNHTSNEHPWFKASRSSRSDPKRDWYWWRDPKPDGAAPNNWLSNFGGPAWAFDAATGQYYLHLFLPQQPDLNWSNPNVVAAMHDVLRFWLRRGVDGYRIDVAHALAKDPLLRDEPPHPDAATLSELLGQRASQQLRIYSQNQPEVHDIIRGFRAVLDEFDAVSVGEVYLLEVEELVRYLGTGRDQLHLAFNFAFLHSAWDAPQFADVIARTEALFNPIDAWPTWTLSNHDNIRHVSRYGCDTAKAAALILLCLRGTPYLYYGEELGLQDAPGTIGHDVVARDPARTPMPWNGSPNAGFTTGTPWLPISGSERNVAAQAGDRHSTLSFYRHLIDLRRREPALHSGTYTQLASPADVLAWRRGDSIDIAVNLGSVDALVETKGTIIAATDHERIQERASRSLHLRPNEGVVLRAANT